MELLFHPQDEVHRMEVYNEYLRKIPELLTQLETVEKMYQKALLEEEMHKSADLKVSLEVGTAWGYNWYDAH